MAIKLPLDEDLRHFALRPHEAFIKRAFDLAGSLILSIIFTPIILVLIVGARISTGESGLFRHERVGLFGEPFKLLKIRSMRPCADITTTVTQSEDPRITKFGKFVRRSKLDELPQVYNVLRGDMSFVGPRPDVVEAYKELSVEHKRLLCVRPGITGPASIAYRHEETLLQSIDNPEEYNAQVIFPDKVRINLAYLDRYSLLNDVGILIKTITG